MENFDEGIELELKKEILKLESKYGKLGFLVQSRLNPSKTIEYMEIANNANIKVNGTIFIISFIFSVLILIAYSLSFPQELLFLLPISLYMLLDSYNSYVLDKKAYKELSALCENYQKYFKT